MSRRLTARLALAAALCTRASAALAGPPFVTDDPEPVEYRHWEVYLASAHQHDASGWSGTAPHLEINYGAVPELQLHLIVPLAYARPEAGPRAYGLGDTEAGAKYRFLDETDHRPQIGTFPLVELPTGDHARGLGDGHVQVFVPIWIQKSVGDWSSYGGGGYWVNPGAGNRDWLLFGLEVQRRLSSKVSLGVEIFHATANEDGGASSTSFNAGVMLDLTEQHHILASAGRGIGGDPSLQGYLAYQLTFGPQ